MITKNLTSPLDAACEYTRRGWSVVPIPYRQKRPVIKEWGQLRLSESELPDYFNQPANLGLILGDPSGGLVDVDLDCDEARDLARKYLPATETKTGRGSAERSHWWYIASDAKTVQHRDPITKQMIVELRATGGQTVVGPSLHPSGESYDVLTGEPTVVAAEMLTACVAALAQRVIELRHGESPERVSPAPKIPNNRPRESTTDVEQRALAYLDRMPPAVSGSGGHAATYAAATVLVHGFEIDPEHALSILLEHYNPRCEPAWTEKELRHKVTSAATKPHDQPRGWLLNESFERLDDVGVDMSGILERASCVSNTQTHTLSSRQQTSSTATEAVDSDLIATLPAKSVRQLLNEHPLLRRPVIHGLLREGETMNVIASPKVGKSWLVVDLALAVATGQSWLKTFDCEAGDVLIVDNELHQETSANRIPKVMQARGIPLNAIAERLFVANVRGGLKDIYGLASCFKQMKPGRFKLIILDAFYRFMPRDTDENDNGAMSQVYNCLDSYAAKLGCSFVLVHHSSKGNQSGKSVTDVGAGAGSQSRATDTHLVLRPHEEPACVVLDAAVRSWPPIEPCGLRWTFPVWTPDDSLDPADLRPERVRRKTKKKQETKPKEPEWDPLRFATEFVSETPVAMRSILKSATDTGMSNRKADEMLKLAEADELVYRWSFGSNQLVKFATVPKPTT